MNTRTNRSWAALALALCVLPFACRASGSEGGPVTSYRGAEATANVEVLGGDRYLRKALEVVEPRYERRDGFLHVQFQLANQTGGERLVEYSVEWFDDSGLSLGRSANWRRVQIPGFGKHTVQLVGPTPEATDWELMLRKATSVR